MRAWQVDTKLTSYLFVLQASQTLQVAPGSIATRVPGLRCVTPEPTGSGLGSTEGLQKQAKGDLGRRCRRSHDPEP